MLEYKLKSSWVGARLYDFLIMYPAKWESKINIFVYYVMLIHGPFLILLFSLIPLFGIAQLNEDFTDGDFTTNPVWSGDDAQFIITSNVLNSNNDPDVSGINTYYLSTASTVAYNASWEFFIDLQFGTSGPNFVDIFLMSDQADLTNSNLNGYFVRIGTGSDDIVLYKITDGSEALLIDAGDGFINSSSSNPFKIRVTRSTADLWTLEYDDGNMGSFTSGGTTTDATFTSSSHFGVRIEQSTLNAAINGHFFDDIVITGSATPDSDPPTISSATVLSSNEVQIEFNEDVDETSVQTTSNYSLNSSSNPTSAVRQANNALVNLTFASNFVDEASNTLTISSVQDLAGNTMVTDDVDFTYVLIENAMYRDIVINEIMARPSPVVGLPNAEFAELFNRSNKKINLKNYIFDEVIITTNDYILRPNEYVILTKPGDVGLFTGNVLGVGFGAISDGGEELNLRDEDNSLDVDIVTYSDDWYKDAAKDDGGYTLEQINPETDCSGENNWSASNNENGGTPGAVNSIFDNTPDTQAPTFESVVVISSTVIELTFSELMDEASLNAGTYSIDNGLTVNSVAPITPELTKVQLTLNTDLASGTTYQVTVSNVNDCPGNTISESSVSFEYDVEAPTITGVQSIWVDEIIVIFDETIDETDAETEANFSIDQSIGAPQSAILTANNQVTLTLETDLQVGTTYQVTASNIEDGFGNAIATENFSFEFQLPPSPSAGDLIINEIMADPSPAVGLPDAEFIEILNVSSSSWNLNQVVFSDASSSVTLPSHTIAPDQFVILTASSNQSLFQSLGTAIGLSSFPSLNNSSETVSLSKRDESQIYSVSYTTEWYADDDKSDGGFSLELINPGSPCSGINNWAASIDESGGTPGSQNSIFDNTPDTTAPTVISARAISTNEIEVTFSEQMDEASLPDGSYSIVDGPAISNASSVSSALIKVRLELSENLESGSTHTLTISGVTDCPGNEIDPVNIDFFFDIQPPTLVSVVPVFNNEIIMIFDEPLNETSAEKEANYVFNGNIGSPSSARLDNSIPTNVQLIFDEVAFSDQVEYEVEILSLKDTSDNEVLSAQSFTFFFELPPSPNPGDILINEIMADPTPAIGLPEAEFVELYNSSESSYNLNQLLFGDGSNVVPLPSFELESRQLVILTSNSAVELFEPTGNVIGVSNFPSLNNTFEEVRLLLRDSSVINSITYTTEWYKDENKEDGGYTLERIGDTTSCGEFFSWSASKNETGGTPGVVNSVVGQPIEIPEVMISNFTTSGDQLTITFNVDLVDGVDELTEIESELTISSITSKSNQLVIDFSEPIEEGTIYPLKLDNLINCDGSVVNDLVIEFGSGAKPSYNELLVTEIMANPDGAVTSLPETEYLEIFNPTDKVISLQGITLSDASSTTELGGALISPSEYIILAPNSSAAGLEAFGRVIGVSSWPSLNNTADFVTLRSDEDIVFSLFYDILWYKNLEKSDGGFSLEMVDSSNPCGRIENWSASIDAIGGTPGKVNSVVATNPDNLGPDLVEAFGEQDFIILDFSEKLNPASVNSAQINIQPDISIEALFFNRPLDDQLLISTSTELAAKTAYSVSVENLTDCLGNFIASKTASFNLPEEAAPLDIVINEILFNPRSGGVDFVEIFNRSDKHINLEDWMISNKEEDVLENFKNITLANLVLEPGEYLVLTENPTTLKADYPSADETVLRFMDLPTFANDEGSVVLLNPDTVEIDAFVYTEDFHLQLLDSFDGVSLERVSTETPTQTMDNWKSAASTAGFATPGFKNSQSRSSIIVNGNLQIEPRVFSPDQSVQADFTTINYSFDNYGNVATVIVYDQSGRPVKTLLENASIPAEGFITWDGTTNDFQKVRIGYYIIQFEIFDITGKSEILRERVVVGGRF
ncbi:MAG: lamin tail domain-containing protein [Cyclobacteriaceae bacterium]